MARARLTRIDAVAEMAAAVDAFRNDALAALEGLDMDIRRALEWIHTDRHEHWHHEVRRGWDRITAARLQLQQARTARRVGEREPACADEKKALARAQKRLETAQEKVEAVRRCEREIDDAVNDYRGARTPLSSWLDSEALKAIAALRRMMDNLETYVALQATDAVPSSARINPPPPEARSEAKPQAAADAQPVVASQPTVERESRSSAASDQDTSAYEQISVPRSAVSLDPGGDSA